MRSTGCAVIAVAQPTSVTEHMDPSHYRPTPAKFVLEADRPRRSPRKAEKERSLPRIERVAAVVAAVGAAAVSVRGGLGLFIAAAVVVVAALVILGENNSTRQWCTASLALTPWLVIRDNSWLAVSIICTVMLVVGLSLLAGATGRSIWNLPIRAVLRRGPNPTPRQGLATPSATTFRSAIIGLIVAVPVVGAFYLLLAEADEVFASIIDLSSIPVVRIVAFLVIFPIAAALLTFGATARFGTRPVPNQRFGSLESTIVLGAVAALFSAFIVIRFATIGRSLDDLGLRDEVRSGFFQLLWVAALTVVLVLAIREVRGGAVRDRMLRRAGLLVITLAAVIDALALYRIWQYVDQSFLTQLRVWSFGFGVWLLVVLAFAALRFGGFKRGSDWFTGALVSSWVVFVMIFAIANPDVRIAEHNFANPPTGADEYISVIPLMELGEDATPVIVANLEVLRPLPNDRFQRVVDHLCATESDNHLREFNFGRRTAAATVHELCGLD